MKHLNALYFRKNLVRFLFIDIKLIVTIQKKEQNSNFNKI
jgi:hypothetical protein